MTHSKTPMIALIIALVGILAILAMVSLRAHLYEDGSWFVAFLGRRVLDGCLPWAICALGG